jgi:hypothetical protein
VVQCDRMIYELGAIKYQVFVRKLSWPGRGMSAGQLKLRSRKTVSLRTQLVHLMTASLKYEVRFVMKELMLNNN